MESVTAPRSSARRAGSLDSGTAALTASETTAATGARLRGEPEGAVDPDGHGDVVGQRLIRALEVEHRGPRRRAGVGMGGDETGVRGLGTGEVDHHCGVGAGEDGRAEAACGVYRRVVHRDGDEVDQREREADREARRRGQEAAVGRRQHDEHQEGGEHDLHHHHRAEPIAAGREVAPTVLGEVVAGIEGVDAVGDDEDQQAPEGGAHELADEVERDRRHRDLAGERHADGDGGVDVTARDVTEHVGHDQQRQAKGERHTEHADLTGGEDGRTRATEHEHGGADDLGGEYADVRGRRDRGDVGRAAISAFRIGHFGRDGGRHG